MNKRLNIKFLIFSLSFILILIWGSLPLVQAQSVSTTLKKVRSLEIEDGFSAEFFREKNSDLLSADDTVAFPPGANTLLKFDDDQAAEDISLTAVAPPENEGDGITLTPLETGDPINTAFDSQNAGAQGFGLDRLYVVDEADQVIAFEGGAQNELVVEDNGSPGVNVKDLEDLSVTNPQGTTMNPSNGTLYFLDENGSSITVLIPQIGQEFADAVSSSIDLPGNLGAARGLAFNPEDSHLYVMSGDKLSKLTVDGDVVTTLNVPDRGIGVLQGMVFAPSLDSTDHPDAHHLFIATSEGDVTEYAIPGSNSPIANFDEEGTP